MTELHISIIAKEIAVAPSQVKSVSELIAEGATVPFIARYRKEATGSLDEVAVTAIRDRLEQLMELDKRREAIVKSLEERGLLTDELKEKIGGAESSHRPRGHLSPLSSKAPYPGNGGKGERA